MRHLHCCNLNNNKTLQAFICYFFTHSFIVFYYTAESFSFFTEERLTLLPPEENTEDDSETYSAVDVDEGRLEPRSDGEDT